MAVAGLADSVNPCALTGPAFLLAYLLHIGSTRGSAAVAGLLFSAGTFAAYLAAGLGLYFVVASSSALPFGRMLVYGAACVGCIVFASASWGSLGAEAPSIGVSPWARRAQHQLVRRVGRLGLMWLAAPLLGACFAALELACTGQLYLPAIALLSREGNWRGALSGLLVYNACFVVSPLALTAVVVAMGRGITSPGFARWAERGRMSGSSRSSPTAAWPHPQTWCLAACGPSRSGQDPTRACGSASGTSSAARAPTGTRFRV